MARIAAMLIVLSAAAHAQEIILQNENVIEWRSITDKGDSIEVVSPKGQKTTVKKADVKELRLKLPTILTGATYTPPEPIKAPTTDLMRVLDPKKDKIQGVWEMEGSSIRTRHEGVFQTLQLPVVPADEYDLKLIVERKGAQSFHLLLPTSQKKSIPVVIHTGLNRSGIFPIDGTTHQNPEKNETLAERAVFEDGKPSTIVCLVRRTRVVVEVNGKLLIDWKIDASRLGQDPEWKPKRADAIAIGAWCDFLVHKVEVTGVAKMAR